MDKNCILPQMCVENDILKVHFRHSWRQYCLFWWQRSKVQQLWDQKLHLKDFFLHLHLICKGLLSSLQLNNFLNRRLLRLFHGLGPSIHRMCCTWKILRLRHWLLNHLQKKGIFHKKQQQSLTILAVQSFVSNPIKRDFLWVCNKEIQRRYFVAYWQTFVLYKFWKVHTNKDEKNCESLFATQNFLQFDESFLYFEFEEFSDKKLFKSLI